jgi:cytochrome b561
VSGLHASSGVLVLVVCVCRFVCVPYNEARGCISCLDHSAAG